MNEQQMNESRLRGWRLRQPSARLKQRIFRASGAVSGWNWQHFAPATACVMFGLLLLHLNGGGALREYRPAMYVDFAAGGQVAHFSDHAQEVENHVDGVTFDWTNHGDFKSSIRFRTGFGPSTNLSN